MPAIKPSHGTGQRNTSLESFTDGQLVTEVTNGNLHAFEKLMRRYNQRNFRIARGYLKDDDEAMDVVQEAYVIAYTKLEQYSGTGSLAGWLGQIVRNETLMRLRKNKRVQYMSNDVLNDIADKKLPIAETTEPEKQMADKQLGTLIEDSIDLLPEDFRIVFMLRGVEQLSIQETADLIGVKPETIKTRFHRARALLQQHMVKNLEQHETGAFHFAGHRCDFIVSSVINRVSG